jgi:hypothetical protein
VCFTVILWALKWVWWVRQRGALDRTFEIGGPSGARMGLLLAVAAVLPAYPCFFTTRHWLQTLPFLSVGQALRSFSNSLIHQNLIELLLCARHSL